MTCNSNENMTCNRCHERCKENEIVVCDTLFDFNLEKVDNNTQLLIVSACNTPTAVYDISTIKTRTNSCTGLTFYQAAVNTDPVEIIQDCNLCDLIRRAIELYFANFEVINCNNGNNNRCCRNHCTFGFF